MEKNKLSAINYSTWTLKALTPVTIHGSNSEKAELRTQTLNGLMRYWYRVLQDQPDSKETFIEENNIFGSASNPASKSKLWIQSLNREPLKSSKIFRPSSTRNFKVDAYREGIEWQIQLSQSKLHEDVLKKGEAVFKLAVLLGGMGQRGRHGASAFVIKELSKDITSIRDYIGQVVNNIRIISNVKISGKPKNYPTIIYRKNKCHAPIYWNQTIIFEEVRHKDINGILEAIREATHRNDGRYKGVLGASQPRFPSPLHTSVYQLKNSYIVTVTEVVNQRNNSNKEYYEASRDFYIDTLAQELKR